MGTYLYHGRDDLQEHRDVESAPGVPLEREEHGAIAQEECQRCPVQIKSELVSYRQSNQQGPQLHHVNCAQPVQDGLRTESVNCGLTHQLIGQLPD